jgi:hypothetical protein
MLRKGGGTRTKPTILSSSHHFHHENVYPKETVCNGVDGQRTGFNVSQLA